MKREILLRWKRRQCDIHAASYVIMGTGLNDYPGKNRTEAGEYVVLQTYDN